MDKTVLVTDISDAIQASHIKELFDCFGIKKLEWSDNPRACLIEFEDAATARAACVLTGTPLGDKKLTVLIAPPGGLEALKSAGTTAPVAAAASAAALPPVSVPAPAQTESASAAATAFLASLGTPAAVAAAAPAAALPGTAAVVPPNPAMSPAALAAWQKHQDEVARTVYVGNVSTETTEAQLRAHFAKCGQIDYVKMAGPAASRQSGTQFCFIEFHELSGAQAALQMNNTILSVHNTQHTLSRAAV